MTQKPSEADKAAAHYFLTELRTRITTQPLPYQHGVEKRALESLWEVFGQAREAMKKHAGCELFAGETTRMLNVDLRPVTAKWHRALEEGRLDSRDGGDEFRADLDVLQRKLQAFAAQLGKMAYETDRRDELTPGPMSQTDIDECMASLRFGIPEDLGASGGVEPEQAKLINAKEAESVDAYRAAKKNTATKGHDAVGLAFSGGGIRSATLCLGAMQVLAQRKLLGTVDFLSTVSGGGYTGSFVSTQLGEGREEKDLGSPHGPDPAPIQTLRRHAKFLVGRSNWESWGMFLQTVLGMLFNWCVPLLALAVATAIAIAWKRWLEGQWTAAPYVALGVMAAAGLSLLALGRKRSDYTRFAGWTMGIAAAVFAATLGWIEFAKVAGLVTIVAGLAFFRLERAKSKHAAVAGWTMGTAAAAAIASLGLWLFDNGFSWLVPGLGRASWTWPQLELAVANSPARQTLGAEWLTFGFVVSLIPPALRFLPWLERPLVRKIVLAIALVVAGLFVPLLAVLVSCVLFALGGVKEPGFMADFGIGLFWLLVSAGGLLAVVLLVLNINTTGPHRLYRRGLARTFVDGATARQKPLDLEDLAKSHATPYHLVNATVNLPNSPEVRLRERRADFFLFSKHWIGSPVVGYDPTNQWKMDGRNADLGTAMAISGAAFSSNMGLGSITPLRAILALLNVRLGYWIRQPTKKGRGKSMWKHPGFFCLLREMSGLAMHERHPWLNLSDGGHIENLAIYELLRRRCKFIVCVDGEADPGFMFQGLLTLVRHAQIDLGVEIAADLRDLRPDPTTGNTRSHYHLCRVKYPVSGGKRPVGLLLYLKLSVTGNESELIARYRANNPAFPHQTTLDQFFDEEQFEAYRQLGVHIAEGLFQRSLMTTSATTAQQPTSVRDWFERLARNLLTPVV